jgi:hypothetical protein
VILLSIVIHAIGNSSAEVAFSRLALAILVGCAIATMFQSSDKAGSFPDLVCELLSLPGDLLATLIGIIFHDRGTASPEFLWRSRSAAAVLFGGLAYWVLGAENSRSAGALDKP